MNNELKKAIIDWLFEHKNTWQRVNCCVENFNQYIYNVSGENKGNHCIGGEKVYEFICKVDKLLFREEE